MFARIWPRSLLICFFSVLSVASHLAAETLVPAKLEDRSPREVIRKKIFPDGSAGRDCKIMSKDPKGIVEADSSLTLFIQSLVRSIKTGDAKALQVLFHPQLKVRTPQAQGALTSIQRISGDKIDATLFRAYGINSLDGLTTPIECADDGLLVHPLFSHPFQVGLWVQVMGADEITRVYAVLVPTKDKWLIGAWHVQQWTHAGKDYVAWRQEAETFLEKKQDLAAWIYLDITSKLLDGGKFLVFPVMNDVIAEKQKILGSKSLKDVLAPKFKDEKLVYASTLFSRKGAAVLLRFLIPGEWSAVTIRDHCKQKLKDISTESWATALAGIRCDYVLPKESIEKEGVLGGIFIER
jgi:hypothetical protein